MNLGNVRVLKVEGAGVRVVDPAGQTSALKEGAFVRQGTKIHTGKDSSVILLFENGTTVKVEPGSEFSIEKFLQDPFESGQIDYQTLKSEPSSSVTRLGIPEGSLVLDIAKLKKDSSFQISTPVGSAGIRGTSLNIRSNRNNVAVPVSIAVATGVVQFKTATGSRAVSGGQAFGIGNTGGFTPNPPGASEMLSRTNQSSSSMKQSVPSQPFQGAPPPASAPSSPANSLNAAQKQAIAEASEKGTAALVAAVESLATQVPEAAAAIAAAAADALPVSASNVAAVAATVAPSAAAQIAANVAQVAPSSAAQVASTVAAIVPGSAVQVAQSVATVAPQAASAIAAAVVNAVPTASATAIQAATQAGAQAASQQNTQGPTGTNQPAISGDQGTSPVGESLPGSTGSSTGGSGTPPRPAPTPKPAS
ncbi:MAG: FecR domain-containing protein [bacterium]